MQDLFQINKDNPEDSENQKISLSTPLAVRMRPKSLSEIIGHSHILDQNTLLPRLISSNNFGSLIFYGPPGCGKTTIALVIAQETKSRFVKINAVLSNVAQLRDELAQARFRKNEKTILFIDEIHRFNKSQQDLLLPDVEDGNIRLIGATTHNPGFYINPPLLSRSHLFKLDPLNPSDLLLILKNALQDNIKGLGNFNCSCSDQILSDIATLSNGDVRRALNTLETIVLAKGGNTTINNDDLKIFTKERHIRYDSNEDEHYDTISAFIKSIRGCDPDAAIYWLAKMLAGGEDVRFIARRLIILASEDIGLADSRALLIANASFDACEKIGQPECELTLAHATLFLATAPKSNSATVALSNAKSYLKNNPILPIPIYLRDSHSKFNKSLQHGADYIYNHDCPNHISGQKYLTEEVSLYKPSPYGSEKQIAERLAKFKEIRMISNNAK